MASVRQGTDAAAISWYSGGTSAKNGDRLHDCTCLTNIRYGAVARRRARRTGDPVATRGRDRGEVVGHLLGLRGEDLHGRALLAEQVRDHPGELVVGDICGPEKSAVVHGGPDSGKWLYYSGRR